jgi:molecular chaperone GrpE
MSDHKQGKGQRAEGKADKQMPKTQPAGDVSELEQQIGELTEALQRERADAVNSRRLHDQALASAQIRAKASVVKDLLPIIDNFERALKHVPKELAKNDYIKGVESIAKQFDKFLADQGVEKIPTTGHPFDPNLHEAVQMEDSQGGEQEIVSEELQAGYSLGEAVIRPAMVKVKLQ